MNMPPPTVAALSAFLRRLCAGLLCLLPAAAVAEPAAVAEVAFVIGSAHAVDAAGASRPLRRGAALYEGQRIETAENGHVHLRFIDGASVAVRPRSRLLIEEYRYVPARPADNRVRFTLERGEARSITGKAGEAAKDRFRLNTPIAAIGIKGTDFVVRVSADDTRAFVLGGAIVMTPLGAACPAESLGGCQGPAARELTAMPDRFLRLTALQRAPELVVLDVHGELNGAGGAHPGQRSAARPPALAGDKSRLPAADALETRAELLVAGVDAPASPPPGPQVVAGMETTVPRLWWGRRAGYADPARPDSDYAHQLAQPEREPIGGLGIFRLLRDNTPIFMAPQGSVDLRLAGFEAYVVQGLKLTPVALGDGVLTLDFAAGRFATRFGAGNLQLQANGVIDTKGRFFTQPGAATLIHGAALNGATQAGFTFRHDLAPDRYLSGATLWAR